mmetsp:Transcript_556/g.1315  ORF Transcript_556/g.1315 Transcript_556/m.1315 type:complete len:99 (+) Transcript_556:759-1055(+)
MFDHSKEGPHHPDNHHEWEQRTETALDRAFESMTISSKGEAKKRRHSKKEQQSHDLGKRRFAKVFRTPRWTRKLFSSNHGSKARIHQSQKAIPSTKSR